MFGKAIGGGEASNPLGDCQEIWILETTAGATDEAHGFPLEFSISRFSAAASRQDPPRGPSGSAEQPSNAVAACHLLISPTRTVRR